MKKTAMARVLVLMAFAGLAAPSQAQQLRLAPMAPTIAECHALSAANNHHLVLPLQKAVSACMRQPPQWGPGYWDHCPDRNLASRIPWSQCDDPQRSLCEAQGAARTQFDICRERAQQRAKAEQGEAAEQGAALASDLTDYAEASNRFTRAVSVIRNPQRFLEQTLPAMASRKFTSIMSDLFGPTGEIKKNKSATVEEYYELARLPVRTAQSLAIRDPFVRFIQQNSLDELHKLTSGVMAQAEQVLSELNELDRRTIEKVARVSAVRPVTPAPQSARTDTTSSRPTECALIADMSTSRKLAQQDLAKWKSLMRICQK